MKKNLLISVLLSLVATAYATPPCGPDWIATVTIEGANVGSSNAYMIGHSPNDRAILTKYVAGDFSSFSKLDNETFGNAEMLAWRLRNLNATVERFYHSGVARPGDIITTKCWDIRVYGADGTIKYLSDGIILNNQPVLYKDFLPQLYWILLLIPLGLILFGIKSALADKRFFVPTNALGRVSTSR